MKLATYQDGSRDGQLIVVSRDLTSAHYATDVAGRLQHVLDDWNFMSPQLQDLYQSLNSGKTRHAFPFEPSRCMAPLPRAYQRAVGTAYLAHAERLQRSGTADPRDASAEPLVQQACSDAHLGPREPMLVGSDKLGIDFEAGLAVITGDIAMRAGPEQALDGVRLLMLIQEVCLRNIEPAERARCAGPLQSRPAAAFSPVAVTLDELGSAWQGGRAALTLQSTWNGRKLGLCEAGPEMNFHFGDLLAQLCKTRPIRAGCIVGSGAVSNADTARGYHSIAHKRAMENIESGAATTAFMKVGDTLRLEARGRDGQSVFGAIDQELVMQVALGDELNSGAVAQSPGGRRQG